MPGAEVIDSKIPPINWEPFEDVVDPPEDVAPSQCRMATVAGAWFASGSWLVSEELAAELLRAVANAKIATEATIRIIGHTDNVPSPIGNQLLSERRAEAVRDVLLTLDVDASRIVEVAGRADLEPKESNDTPDGREANRRVEIISCVEVGS